MNLFKIGSNTAAMNSLNSLYNTNESIGKHQARLSSGKRINSAQDDTAGYAIASSLKSRASGLKSALNNVTNARSILTIAEGGYQAQMDILQTIKDKVIQANDGSLSNSQRQAINDQVEELVSEIDEIKTQTKWNGSALMSGSAMTFHVGADSGDTMAVTLTSSTSATLSGTITTGDTADHTLSEIVTDADPLSLASTDGSGGASIAAAIEVVDGAIDELAGIIQDVGDKLTRLSSKEDTLAVSVTNTDAVRSTYEDADFAKEQMEIMKFQILQQTAVASLAQANAMPSVVLSLFR